ncbi:hypothetical protein GGI42DRAFT_359103 [Trichoderma sp. SZMC 28013]
MAAHASEKAVVLHSGHMALYKVAHDEDRVILPAMYATVRLDGGSKSFLYGAEAELPPFSKNKLELSYRYQPCWLWPRKSWPKEEPTASPAIRDVEHAAQAFHHIPSNDADLPSIASCHHLWRVHCFLDDSLNRRRTKGANLEAMLRIILRGIRHVACTLDGWFAVETDGMHNPVRGKRNGGFELAYRCSFPDATRFHSKVKGYRLVAGFMSFQDFHFTAFVWDRVDKTLFHFDSLQEGRDERARAAVASWANFLIDAGLPYDFSYVVVPATGQRGDWESGYACLMFLQHTLRGLVGLDSTTLASFIRNKLIEKSRLWLPSQDAERIPEFQLRFRDWCMTGTVDKGVLAKPPGGVTRLEQGTRYAVRTTQYMALNELGILQEVRDSEGMSVRLGVEASTLRQTSGRCRADAALTPIGGKSFVTYEGLGTSSGYYPHFRVFKADDVGAIVRPWRRSNKLPREAERVKLPPRFRPKQRLSPPQPPPSSSTRVGPGTDKRTAAQLKSGTCVDADVAEEASQPPPAAKRATPTFLEDDGLGNDGSQDAAASHVQPAVEQRAEAPPAHRDGLYTSAFFAPIGRRCITTAEEEPSRMRQSLPSVMPPGHR